MTRTSCRPACDGEPCPPGQCVADRDVCPATLKGAVIRDKGTGTVWRVVAGERMWHVQRALARAIEYGKGHAYCNAVRSDERGRRPDKVLALVVRTVGPWAASV